MRVTIKHPFTGIVFVDGNAVDVPALIATLRQRERLVQVADEHRREAERKMKQIEEAMAKAEGLKKETDDKVCRG